MKKLLLVFLIPIFTSCSCEPEDLARLALSGMETMMGEGFMPSEEIRALGDFQGMSVNLSKSYGEPATIFLKLENGDPIKLGQGRESLARKCAELYLNDFENAKEYEQITVQFFQTDPQNPQNVAMEEYAFQVKDFGLEDS
ncbi:hypothetical protein Aoki45_27960 [Algoriphagus sp. oki45]|uniref:hypothetical protein n=1 Tax=Algoriphagus sp. oki45 TaxID=3067294 RepID=UPI0027F9D383|nr:hypothetical protein Aoki45_27960 [Algoriphagus sp. oki45]